MKDENAKKQAEFDQATATIGESYPGLWRRLYENSLAVGFDEQQAFRLVCCYILANGMTTTIRP